MSIQETFFSPLIVFLLLISHRLIPFSPYLLLFFFFPGQQRENVAEILHSGACKGVAVIISTCST